MSIKPRIKDPISIDVRVHIDAAGRVTSAAPVVKQPSGLHAYLAGRAVEAARLWRFDPARENGRPVPGIDTIHFVFEN
jgi:TonB family protein